MSQSQKKIYVGNGKVITTKNGNSFRKVGLNLSRIAEQDIEEFVKKLASGKEILNVTIWDKEEADQYGNDVEVLVDTWKPTGDTTSGYSKPKGYSSASKQPQIPKPEEEGDLPF